MKITIENLTFKCIIGILPFERKNKQKISINISFKYDFKKHDFIDYSQIVSFVETTMKEKKFKLIEDAIVFLKKQLMSKYPIKKLKITIKKPDIIDNCVVGVSN